MQTFTHFLINLLLLLAASLFNLWTESWAYWYVPDALFVMIVWLQFVDRHINYLALILVCMVNDIYSGNQLGSMLLAITIVIYIMGILNFVYLVTSPFIAFVVLVFSFMAVTQLVLFVNFGFGALLAQMFHLSLIKAVVTAALWLVLGLAMRLHLRNSLAT